eukprot:GHVR01070824.1.p1 GENE.GHVR01070824.1~~GHVR01070824.1.p1  ORF type:complete len:121 (+),score=27.73 GHVR01070824.1:187-549(+)
MTNFLDKTSVASATSKKWEESVERKKQWDEKKGTEGGPPSTRQKTCNGTGWPGASTSNNVSHTSHTDTAPIFHPHTSGLVEEQCTFMIPDIYIDESLSACDDGDDGDDNEYNTHIHAHIL